MKRLLEFLKHHVEPYFLDHHDSSFYIASLLIIGTLFFIRKSNSASLIFPKKISLNQGLLIILGFCFFLFFIMSAFVYPQAEDIAIAQRVHEFGSLGYIYDLHTTFDGRYFTNALYSFNPLVYRSFIGYKALPFGFFLFFLLSTWYLIRSLTNRHLKTSYQVMGALVFVCLYIFEIPNIWNSFYYMASSYVYMLPVILTLFLSGLMVRIHSSISYGTKLVAAIACMLLIVAIAGGNELFMPYMLLLTGLTTVVSFWRKNSEKWVMLMFFVIAVFASAMNMTAPGIIQSFKDHPVEKDFGHLITCLKTSIYYGFDSLWHWTIYNPALFLFSALLIPVSYSLVQKDKFLQAGFHIHPVIALLIYVLTVLLSSFPYYWSLGTEDVIYPERIFNVVYFVFLIGWFITLHITIAYLTKRLPNPETFFSFQPNKPVAITSLILCLLFAENFKLVFYDFFSGKAIGYEKEMSARYSRLIKGGKKPGDSTTVYFHHLANKPKSIWTGIAIDPNRAQPGWNVAFEKYFNVWEVKYPSDTISKAEYNRKVDKGEITP